MGIFDTRKRVNKLWTRGGRGTKWLSGRLNPVYLIESETYLISAPHPHLPSLRIISMYINGERGRNDKGEENRGELVD